MREIILISFVLIAAMVSNCGNIGNNNSNSSIQKSDSAGTSEIIFREYQHDFGKVKEGEKLSYTFIFDNKGPGNLILTSATTTCGCTVPEYDTKPIPPGSNGDLKVVFDTSGRNGTQTKVITVKSNASTPVVLVKITAEVVAAN
jgi:hypothetical protein